MSLGCGRCVANLLENAQVHTPAGAPSGRGRRSRRMGVLAVIDSGPGIDPDQVPHVFERFYRGTPPGSGDAAPRTKGSGLGLAIVKTIAEAHGGTATVTSHPGRCPLRTPAAAGHDHGRGQLSNRQSDWVDQSLAPITLKSWSTNTW